LASIAAAVVGYYFGQKNLEEATRTAESATKIAKDATVSKKKVERKTVGLGKKAVPVYKDAEKLVTAVRNAPPEVRESISKEVNLESLKSKLDERIQEVEGTVKTMEKEMEEDEE
jgi:Sec-independent protein translocase protein TatA